jgi:hypothetical protein
MGKSKNKGVDMSNKMSIVVDKILGSKQLPGGKAVRIGLESSGNEYNFDFTPDLLADIALTALKGKSNWDSRFPDGKLNGDTPMQVFPCDKWEIRVTNDKAFLILIFRVVGGAWIRLQLPHRSTSAIRETLEAAEGRNPLPPFVGRRN